MYASWPATRPEGLQALAWVEVLNKVYASLAASTMHAMRFGNNCLT